MLKCVRCKRTGFTYSLFLLCIKRVVLFVSETGVRISIWSEPDQSMSIGSIFYVKQMSWGFSALRWNGQISGTINSVLHLPLPPKALQWARGWRVLTNFCCSCNLIMCSFISGWLRVRRLKNHSNSRPKVNCLEFLNTFKLIMRANMAADQGRILHTCVTEYLCRRCLVFYSNYFLFLTFAKIFNAGDFNTSAGDWFRIYSHINLAPDVNKFN